jgi:hypothetical protein
LLSFLLLPALPACSNQTPDDPVESSDSAISDYDAKMKAACLAALPTEMEAEGPVLTDEQAADLSAKAELSRGFILVAHVFCSTQDYWGDRSTPYCSRDYRREAINSNYAPAYSVENGRSYRHVVAKLDESKLALTTTSTYGSPPSFDVKGAFGDLTVTMKPGPSATLPEDLALLESYSHLEFHGRMTDHELVLTKTDAPVVVWNTASCGRASLRMTY